MTLAHPDARSWAGAHSASDPPRLGLLEAVACQAHPEVVATFGDDGAAIAGILGRRPAGVVRRWFTGIGLLLVIVGCVAPIAGVAVIGAETYLVDRIPAERSVPTAAVFFSIAVAMLIVTGVVWLRSGARWSDVVCGIGVVSALCGAFASISMPTVSGRDDYELPTIMQLPVWTTLAIGALLALVTALRLRVREPEPQPTPVTPVTISERHAAEQAARSIPGTERDAILADRDAALRILADRGLLDETTLGRALASPLGTLFTLDDRGTASAGPSTQ